MSKDEYQINKGPTVSESILRLIRPEILRAGMKVP